MGNKNRREDKSKANASSKGSNSSKTIAPSPEQRVMNTASLSLGDIKPPAPSDKPWIPVKSSSAHRESRVRTPRPTRTERPKPEVINVEVCSERERSATADVTIRHEGITHNHVQITRLTFEDGTTQQKVEYPFDEDNYNFVAHFTDEMSSGERITFLNQSWIEIVLDTRPNLDESIILFEQLDSLGPDFVNNVKKLDIKVRIPEHELIANRNVKSLPSTPAGQYLQQVVKKVKEYAAIEHMNIVIVLPEACPEGMFDIQLAFILPFFLIKFTKWRFKYQIPGIRYPKITPDRDLGRLIQMNEDALSAEKAAKVAKAVKIGKNVKCGKDTKAGKDVKAGKDLKAVKRK